MALTLHIPKFKEQQKSPLSLLWPIKKSNYYKPNSHLKEEKGVNAAVVNGQAPRESGNYGGGHMLTQIQIKKFKSYQEQVLHLSPLTLMIGANASGKVTLEAFRFLAWLAQGQKLSVLAPS